MENIMCHRCLTIHSNKEEMRKGKKHKHLTEEASKDILMCKNCKCQCFITIKGK